MFKLVVLSIVLAAADVSSSAIAPLGIGIPGLGAPLLAAHGLGAPLLGAHGLGAPLLGAHLAAPLAAPVLSAPAIVAHNYRGPLSLGPGQPANIVAADGRPLDTISVNLDRAAHLTARAVDGAHSLGLGLGHVIGKRSAPLLAPAAAWSHSARIDVPTAHLGAPLLGPIAAPLSVAPLAHAGVLGHAGLLARPGLLGHGALGHLW